jgi:hypothetical protein
MKSWIVSALTFLAHLVWNGAAELFPISDASYPYLVITDPSMVNVAWHIKSIAFRLAHSAAVRINSRGIRFIPSVHTLHLSMQKGVQETLRDRESVYKPLSNGSIHVSLMSRDREGTLTDDEKILVHDSTAINR